MIYPPIKTARAQSELFAVQCDQWEPIQNSQLIGKYQEKSTNISGQNYMSTDISWSGNSQFYPGKTYGMDPPVTFDRQQSDHFTVPCCS